MATNIIKTSHNNFKEEFTVNEEQKAQLESLSKHALHGVEDAANVVGHGLGGAVKGVADGVESVSTTSQTRKEKATEEDVK
jgi:Ca2+-dependent lipid-binding protein